MKNKTFELNAGSGMVMGILISAFVALIVSMTTGDNTIWSWAVPVGIATGLAIGAGRSKSAAQKELK